MTMEIDWKKSIIATVVLFLVMEIYSHMTGKLPWNGVLPGDTVLHIGNGTFYVPIMTTIILSIAISLVFLIIEFFRD